MSKQRCFKIDTRIERGQGKTSREKKGNLIKKRKKNPPSMLHQIHFVHTIYMCYTVLEKWIWTGFCSDCLTPTMNLYHSCMFYFFMIIMAQVAGGVFFFLLEEWDIMRIGLCQNQTRCVELLGQQQLFDVLHWLRGGLALLATDSTAITWHHILKFVAGLEANKIYQIFIKGDWPPGGAFLNLKFQTIPI